MSTAAACAGAFADVVMGVSLPRRDLAATPLDLVQRSRHGKSL
ncbi:hypothetical protein I552_10057 [Mycobacterium xenopi 3993]|nr:hypothetical protein I552_10057 [Mycobacterium xenopi 3993]